MRALMSLVLLLLGLGAGFHAHSLGLWSGEEPGAGLFPFIFSSLLAAIMAVELATCPWPRPSSADVQAALANRRFQAYFFALVLYVVTFRSLGFVPSSVLAFVLIMRMGERLAWRKVAALAVPAILVAHIVLQRWLGVPLPAGLLG
jgi:hypothetical protein